jgi:hypothetical protein
MMGEVKEHLESARTGPPVRAPRSPLSEPYGQSPGPSATGTVSLATGL